MDSINSEDDHKKHRMVSIKRKLEELVIFRNH